MGGKAEVLHTHKAMMAVGIRPFDSVGRGKVGVRYMNSGMRLTSLH